MPIPCFQGTCSNDMTFDPITGLSVSTRLSPTGSIVCDPEASPNGGLYVEVAGLTGDATSGVLNADIPCGQSLRRDTLGNLYAIPEGSVGISYASDPEGLRSFGDDDNYNTHLTGIGNVQNWTIDIDNPFDCPAWCFYTIGEMRIIGKRLNAVVDQPFYYIGDGQVIVAGNLMGGAVNRQDIHGVWAGTTQAAEHFHGWNMHALFLMGAGEVNRPLTNRITTDKLFHFSTTAATGGGVSMAHAAAIFVRQDCVPVRGFNVGPC